MKSERFMISGTFVCVIGCHFIELMKLSKYQIHTVTKVTCLLELVRIDVINYFLAILRGGLYIGVQCKVPVN